MTLTPLELPRQDGDWTAWLDERARGSVRLATGEIDDLKQLPAGDAAILRRWDAAVLHIDNAFAITSLLGQVHPEAEVIELAETIEVEVSTYSDELHMDTEVHAQLSSLDPSALDAAARRVLEDALRSFRRSGVDRDEATRDELRRLNEKETELSQAFGRNIRDGRRELEVPVAALDGLPADWVEGHPADEDGMVTLTTEYPDAMPFLTFSSDAEARREFALEFFNIAWPENDAVLSELLRVRDAKAKLLGYADWPTYDAEVKMIGKGDAIPPFFQQVADDAEEAGRREIARLAERAAPDGSVTIDVSSWRYHHEGLKRDEYGVDAQEVRRYFSFPKVHDGLLDVTGRLFGVRYERVEVSTWHEDVTSYDVHLGDRLLGRIHLDLHPRERKYNHAAQFTLVSGVKDRQLAEGVLVCNFPRGLMEHQQVVTLFHEFGHLLHHVLAGHHEWARFSGVATEWDFVEAPSQMLEEWAWDAGVLQGFATDEAGTPIPAELVQRMREADEFGKGFLTRTQMLYAALSYRFHQELPDDLTERLFELFDEFSLVAPIEGTHFHAGFGHLAGYTSAYYTYMWSKVIAKDLFSAFDPENLFDTEVAFRYRDQVLAPGGSADAADLVADFLGRPYNTEAFSAWLNG